MTLFRPVALSVLLVTTLLLVVSCAFSTKRTRDDVLFERVRIGMERQIAERILGRGLIFDGGECFYGAAPKLEEGESPYAPGSIAVIYSVSNTVKAKFLYGQKRYDPTLSLRQDLKSKRIAAVRILHVDLLAQPVACSSPDDVDRYAKFVTTVRVNGKIRHSLEQGLDNITFSYIDRNADLHWGAIFIDGNSNVLHSIYIGDRRPVGRYVDAFIDWKPMTVTDPLIRWIESNSVRTNCSKD